MACSLMIIMILVLVIARPIVSEPDEDIMLKFHFSSQAFIFDKSIREEPFICGGVVIDVRWIISNAHCYKTKFKGFRPDPKYYAVTGLHNLRDFRYRLAKNLFTSDVEAVFQHPLYYEESNYMDVAVLKMKTDFPKYYVAEVSRDPFPSQERTCILVGWREQLKAPSNEIQSVMVKVNNYMNCVNKMETMDSTVNKLKERSFICSMSPSRATGPCAGMFGGSLFCDGLLTGVLHEDNVCDVERLREYVDIATVYNWIAPRMPNLVGRSLDKMPNSSATVSDSMHVVLYCAFLCAIVY